MPLPLRPFKFSGMLPKDDVVHAARSALDSHIAPIWVTIPGGDQVPQYAPTVKGTAPTTFNPATDCQGAFMSSKYQPNNNCYNYATDIATNSFAQPGRLHGIRLNFPPKGQDVRAGAEADGLRWLGVTYPSDLVLGGSGHVVCLLISDPVSSFEWPGDYHWVRFDKTNRAWSQKDGGDQITNYDFAGNSIANPADSNWQVNLGPLRDDTEGIVGYAFYGFLLVPSSGVAVI